MISTVLEVTPRLWRKVSKVMALELYYGRSAVTNLEDSRRIVVYGIDARSILPEEQHASQEKTPQEEWALAGGLEGLPKTDTDRSLLRLMGLVNSSHLFSDVHVGGSQLTDPAQIFHSLRPAVVQEEPARGFPHPDGAQEKETGWDQLDSEWNNPLSMRRLQVLFYTVLNRYNDQRGCSERRSYHSKRTPKDVTHVYPKAQHTTNLPPKFVKTDETTADSRRCQLRKIDGDNVGGDTSTQSRQDTASVQNSESSIAIRTTLETSSQRESGRCDG